ncbi:MAG TPA: TolC family protein, partial [Puia sp.]
MFRNYLSGLSGALLLSLFIVQVNAQAPARADAQPLTLKDAVKTALDNYGAIRAKANYVKASQANVLETKREYLPDLNISAQHDYGTINGTNGPMYGYKG